MNISGIRPTSNFYNNYIAVYNNNRISDELSAPQDTRGVDKVGGSSDTLSDEEIREARAGQVRNSYDFAKEYDPTREYSMKGSESELKNLDVMKAISDMEKDKAIAQYQFFVGDRDTKSDIIGLEDFTL